MKRIVPWCFGLICFGGIVAALFYWRLDRVTEIGIESLKEQVRAGGLAVTWRYHGSDEKFHFFSARATAIIVFTERRYRVGISEVIVPDNFEFVGWVGEPRRQVFQRWETVNDRERLVADPDWLFERK